ncbi:class I SAM-dependent methyltransferase [Limimonas halophila]|uniref:class I SAM-dependent methyltransferase n=1 Tax=Limimonas halophila TaxID=1082479 RepID=UPI0015A487B8|nr:class I SAM-dependent methyltransferase [Limimonas halophila]
MDYYERNTLGFRLRQRRFAQFRRLLEQVYDERGQVNILDMGGTGTYWRIAGSTLTDYNCHVHLVNPDLTEVPAHPNFRLERRDARDLRHLPDQAFDVVHSNSVIEHVGGWQDMRSFAREVRRLAPRYFVQTPNFWFPVEPHFRAPLFHWLPEQLRARALQHIHLGFADQKQADMDEAMCRVHGVCLLDKAQMATLFPDARIETETFALLTKSLIAVRDGLS